MAEVNRPLSLQLTSAAPRANAAPIQRSNSTTTTPIRRAKLTGSTSGSSSSSSSLTLSPTSSIANNHDPPDSPSLILPYLYVGDQTQTQIDTISSLNISYVLSLQSLPKFLDTTLDTKLETQLETSERQRREHKQTITCATSTKNGQQTKEQHSVDDERKSEPDGQDCVRCSSEANENDSITKELLPSMNSSKDYLVKFQSCVNRLIKGKCINISDTFEQLVDKFFDETHNFIEEARRNKCNILVHCKAGISRSPTIAIAYLMKWKRLHLNEAYQFVKQCRPQISPNLNFMGQLINYEKQLIQRGVHRPNCATPTPLMPSPSLCCLPGPYLVDDHHTSNQLDRPTYENLPILNVIQTK